MELKMEVYTPSLELIGLLQIQRSVLWEDKAFSAGSFSLESIITGESRALLVPENILWLEGETAGIIEYVRQEAGADGPYISVKGRTLTGILDRRILWGRYNLTGTVPSVMRRLVDDCCVHPTRGNIEARKIPALALADVPEGGASIRVQKTGGTLLEALEELGEAYQVAFGVRFNPEVPQMEFWARPGVNRSVQQTNVEPVFYSTELDDVLSSEYSYDSGNYRNAALVAGEGEGDGRVLLTVEDLTEPAPEPPDLPDPPDPPDPPEPPELVRYTVSLSVDPAGSGTVSGGGDVEEGGTVTVSAVPGGGYTFAAWKENGVIVSKDSAYTFTVSGNRSLTAVFEAAAIDTVDWTAAAMPAKANWYSISFGDGKFAVLTSGGNVSTGTAAAASSPDGITWTSGTVPSALQAYKMAYGGGTFVAPAMGSGIAYSADGLNWETASPPSSGNWSAVAYGNGVFVAIKRSSQNAAYSTDGIHWTAANMPVSANWYDVTFGSGIFVAVSAALTSGSRVAAYSTDGKTWKQSSLPSNEDWQLVVYGGGKFIAFVYGSNKAAYSANGSSWTALTLPKSGNRSCAAYGNNKFVVLSTGSKVSLYSKDGLTWEEAELPVSATWRGVAFGNNRFVAVANNNDQCAYCLA